MVFLIQNSQNRDAKAVQIKLDELIRSILQRRGYANDSARNQIINVENSSEQELQELQQDFSKLGDRSKE
jgi:low affinity Fe/Cu permease